MPTATSSTAMAVAAKARTPTWASPPARMGSFSSTSQATTWAPTGSARALLSDVPGDTSTAAMLPVGGAVTGTIDYTAQWHGDEDWYRVEVLAGRTYVFELGGAASGAGTLEEPFLRLWDGDGNEIASSEEIYDGADAVLAFTAEADGTMFAAAAGYGGSVFEDRTYHETGTYRLSLREVIDDVPGDAATTASLAVGGSLNGTIDYPADQDWYRVEVVAGRTYVFDLEGVDTGVGTLRDPVLGLLDAEGGWIAWSYDGGVGRNAQLGFTAISTGHVLVSAEDYTETDGARHIGTYRLSARELTGDVAGSTATTAVLALDAPVAGAVDFAGDSDWFRFTVEGGRTYVFDLEGAATDGGTLTYGGLQLFYAGGEVLRDDWQGAGVGDDTRVVFTPARDGELILAASGDALGTYRLVAREIEPDALLGDLPRLREGVALPAAALQGGADNAPGPAGEVFLTWLGGVADFANAVGVARIAGDGALDPELAFTDCTKLAAGDALSLGYVGVFERLGLFALSDGARQVPDLDRIGPDQLLLRNPVTGAPANAADETPPALLRLDGAAPAVVDTDLVFAFADPLNAGGHAQATVGSFLRDGIEVCRVVAFEDDPFASGHSDGDFNDAVLALSVGRLTDADLAEIQAWLFG